MVSRLIIILILVLTMPCLADSCKVYLDVCTWINAGSATSNYDGGTTFSYGYSWNYRWVWLNGAIDDSVTVYGAYTIDSMRTYAYVVSLENFGTGDSLVMVAYENLRDAVENEMTWNIYSTGNSWATPGAGGAGTDVSSDSIVLRSTTIKAGDIAVDDTVLLGTLIGSVVEEGIPYGIIWKVSAYFNDDSRPLFESDDDAVVAHRPWGMIYMTAGGEEEGGRKVPVTH